MWWRRVAYLYRFRNAQPYGRGLLSCLAVMSGPAIAARRQAQACQASSQVYQVMALSRAPWCQVHRLRRRVAPGCPDDNHIRCKRTAPMYDDVGEPRQQMCVGILFCKTVCTGVYLSRSEQDVSKGK